MSDEEREGELVELVRAGMMDSAIYTCAPCGKEGGATDGIARSRLSFCFCFCFGCDSRLCFDTGADASRESSMPSRGT